MKIKKLFLSCIMCGLLIVSVTACSCGGDSPNLENTPKATASTDADSTSAEGTASATEGETVQGTVSAENNNQQSVAGTEVNKPNIESTRKPVMHNGGSNYDENDATNSANGNKNNNNKKPANNSSGNQTSGDSGNKKPNNSGNNSTNNNSNSSNTQKPTQQENGDTSTGEDTLDNVEVDFNDIPLFD